MSQTEEPEVKQTNKESLQDNGEDEGMEDLIKKATDLDLDFEDDTDNFPPLENLSKDTDKTQNQREEGNFTPTEKKSQFNIKSQLLENIEPSFEPNSGNQGDENSNQDKGGVENEDGNDSQAENENKIFLGGLPGDTNKSNNFSSN